MKNGLMTEKDAAEFLKVSLDFLRNDRWRAGDEMIPYSKIGRLVRYRRADLEKFVEARMKTPAIREE